ncbi:MAG: outer membrane protein assembly factor BamA [Bdellovibrionales bacterium]|nr:outer membrane protein assembly factor BamA [Bdellovibrionales bacterium]
MLHRAYILGVAALIWSVSFAAPAAAAEPQLDYTQLSGALSGKSVSTVSYLRGQSVVALQRVPKAARILPETVLEAESVSNAVKALYRQDIYSHIDVEAKVEKGNQVALKFYLTPTLIVRDTEFFGVTAYKSRELRRIAGLRRGRPVDPRTMLDAVQKLETAFHQAGYYQPRIDVTLRQSRSLSSVLVQFTVIEGKRSVVSNITLDGEIPPDLSAVVEKYIKRSRKAIASKRRVEELRRELVRTLRGEGYLEAAVRTESLRYLHESGDIALEFAVDVQQPISISFTGNVHFSASELIELLKLDTRTAPFGPNAIPNFVRDIRDLYERDGYYGVKLSHQALSDSGARRRHLIEITEGPVSRIKRIRFDGNAAFSDDELSRLISTSEPSVVFAPWKKGFLVSARLAKDVESIKDFYRTNGFFYAEINSDVQTRSDGKQLVVSFVIKENKQTTVSSVIVNWIDAAKPNRKDIAAKLLTISPDIMLGDVLSVAALEQARQKLLSDIYALGFPEARATPRYDIDSGEVGFDVSLGQQVTVADIVIRGNRATLNSVIRRELLVSPGEAWNPELIRKSEHSLYQLGVFQNVKLEPEDGAIDQAEEVLAVSLIERDTGGLAAGVSYNTEDGIGLLTELSQRNVFGRAHRFVLSAELFFRNGDRFIDAARGRVGYNLPRFITRDGELYSEIFAQEEVEFSQSFSYDRHGASTVYRQQLTESLSGSLGYTIFNENLFDVPQAIVAGPNDSGHTFYSGIRTELILDRRNDIYNPSSGYQSKLALFAMPEAFGSEVSIVGATFTQSFFLKFNESLVWANNARAEIIEPFASTDVVPLGRRLFLGGRTTLRGYSPNSIGPKGDEGYVAGGDSSLLLNSELHFEVAQDVILLTFLDVGQAVLRHRGTFEGDTQSYFGDLRYSPGLGLRYRSPIGPIGADLGFAVNQKKGEEFGRLSINIGGAF